MEGDDINNDQMGNISGANSRWNPTKEQIDMLESLYTQGVRTPSAEQIQQITGRLRAYGNIEGKNVFYWFQNHKARQRQKQKQERMALFNRYLHHHPHHKPPQPVPMFPPPCPNVVCRPYYLPRNDLGFYSQYTKMVLPSGSKRRARTDKETEKTTNCGGLGFDYQHQQHEYNNMMMMGMNYNSHDQEGFVDVNSNDQETLSLFPVHPTGILQGKTTISSVENSNTTTSSSSETNYTGNEDGSGADHQPFFDFFSGQKCESD